MAIGIYIIWCFVLTGSCTHVLSSVVQYSQTVPNAGTVPCPGDRVQLTCVTDTGAVFWKVENNAGTIELSSTGQSTMQRSFYLSVIAINGNMITSTATIESVNISLNGSTIGCSDEFNGLMDTFVYLHINVTGPPIIPVSISVKLINNNALVINWTQPQQCINHYIITVTSNNTNTENSTVNTSSAVINIILGTNYSFSIIPIDTIGREGPPSSLIQYIWNVPSQVLNISWDQISTDSITIWWNNEDTTALRPSIEYYIISVYITTICINSCSVYSYNVTDTIITITELSPINEYYTVTIIPVNVIGYGPSVTVNVSITTTTASITDIIMSTTDFITTQDKSLVMTTVTKTQLITTTETIMSSYIESYASCNTTGTTQSTDVGSINVAIAVPITGLLTGLITAIITSIIVCLIMKKRGTTIQNKTLVGGGGGEAVIGPIYDLPNISTEQQEQIIDTKLNTAYGQTEKNQQSL